VIGTIVFFVSAFSASFCAAAAVVLDPLVPTVFGAIRTTIVSGNETLIDVARRENCGYDVLVNSNRSVDPWRPGNGTEIILPGKSSCRTAYRPD
jgi:L,D-transpeptidase ErfK/SrfK